MHKQTQMIKNQLFPYSSFCCNKEYRRSKLENTAECWNEKVKILSCFCLLIILFFWQKYKTLTNWIWAGVFTIKRNKSCKIDSFGLDLNLPDSMYRCLAIFAGCLKDVRACSQVLNAGPEVWESPVGSQERWKGRRRNGRLATGLVGCCVVLSALVITSKMPVHCNGRKKNL